MGSEEYIEAAARAISRIKNKDVRRAIISDFEAMLEGSASATTDFRMQDRERQSGAVRIAADACRVVLDLTNDDLITDLGRTSMQAYFREQLSEAMRPAQKV